jgi:hypothetical protein
VCGVLLAGCYELLPAGPAAQAPGVTLAFDINDRGRVALGGLMGPEIAQIEGRLVDRDTSEYVIAVTGVRLLRGGEQVWKGERVRIRNEYINTLYERRFSRSRTLLLSAVGIGAVALIAKGSILTGRGDEQEPLPPPTGSTVLIPGH